MRHVAIRLLLISLILVAAVGVAVAAPNDQAGALLPAVVSFHADVTSLSYADVEAGTAQVTLSWETLNTNGQYRVMIDEYHQNYWVSLVGANQALPLSGSMQVNVATPENFGEPTYRLTLKTTTNEVVEQRFVTLPYSPAAQDAPAIVSFTTPVQAVDLNLLVQNNTRLAVHYEIANRQPDTLIRFEQVLPDGSTVDADLPRRVLWVPSKGDGIVVAQRTSSKDDLRFRLSLINLRDGSVADEAELTIPVTGQVVIAPSGGSQQVVAPPSDQTSAQAEAQPMISADSETAAPGGDVTLSWNAGDAESVELLAEGEGAPTTLYIALPPSGTMTVPVPEESAGVTYTLRAQNADGTVTTGEVNVTPPEEGAAEGGG